MALLLNQLLQNIEQSVCRGATISIRYWGIGIGGIHRYWSVLVLGGIGQYWYWVVWSVLALHAVLVLVLPLVLSDIDAAIPIPGQYQHRAIPLQIPTNTTTTTDTARY